MAGQDWAEEAVEKILDDISDRAGLGDALGDMDDETRAEMVEVWVEAIRNARADTTAP